MQEAVRTLPVIPIYRGEDPELRDILLKMREAIERIGASPFEINQNFKCKDLEVDGKADIDGGLACSKLDVKNDLTCEHALIRRIHHSYGGFQDVAATQLTLTTQNTWYHVTNAGNNLWVGLEGDEMSLAADVMTINKKADYFGLVSLTFSGQSPRDFQTRLYNVTQSHANYQIGATATGTANYTNIVLPIYIEPKAGDQYRVEMRCTSHASAAPYMRSAIFYLIYLHE